MKRHAILAPLVGFVLVLAACGGDGNTAIDPPAEQTSDGSATTDPVDVGGDLRSPTPIKAASAGANAAQTSAESVAADVPEGERMIAPFVAEYVLADNFPALPTDDTGYVFDITAEVSADRVREVAAAFGVAGEPVRAEDDSWVVGPNDGTAASLWVYTGAQQSWNYNAPWNDGDVREVCAVSLDSEGNESSDCPEPTPPTGVPTAAEAEQRARESLTALGVDTSALTFENYADEWSANVSVDDRTADRPAIRTWNFGFGAEGVLQWAGGLLATPQPVGPYPLIDLDTAVDRLRNQGGFGAPMPMIDAPVAEADAATSEPAPGEGDEVVTSETLVVSDPLPVDPEFDPEFDIEAMTITLVDVEADLWWVWDADNTVWLVPAYRFIDTDGGWHTVPAVTDDFLIQSEPTDVPIPVEPDGGIGDGAEPSPPPESLPVAPDEEPVDIRPTDDPETALAVLGELVGLSIEEFTAEAKALGYSTRVAEQDGEALAVTADFSETRVNVAVEGPRVIAIQSIG